MYLLAVDRSSSHSGAALFRDSVCLAEQVTAGEPARAPAWMADVRNLLSGAGVTVRQLDRLAVGLGPGSFSGIRAAVAGLQGLGLPHGIPLAGVSSAAALAFRRLQASPAVRRITVLGDARRERLWAATFEQTAGGRLAVVVADGQVRPPTHTAADFCLGPLAEVVGLIPDGAVVMTPDWARLGARLTTLLPPERLLPGEIQPTAVDVARLVCADLAASLTEPVPIYLHPPVAVASNQRAVISNR
jgi:tRNA threonylcarbamoyl adenosine modification protein YeaZ